MENTIAQFRGEGVKSTGDGYLALFDGPGRAIECALTAARAMRNLGLSLRSGLHTGEVEKIGEDVGGIAVHIAARVMEKAPEDEVWASRTVKDLVVGSRFKFTESGTHDLKGVDGPWPLYRVCS